MTVVYVAFLRGINVGGNNLIKMAELKVAFEKMGFSNVATYIQSGNVIFETKKHSERLLETKIEKAIGKSFDYKAKVVVRSFKAIERVIKSIPGSWAKDATKRYNVMFLRSSIDSKKILNELEPKEAIETVIYKPGVLLWSASISDLTRTAMVKLVRSQGIYQEMTMRNLNTTNKIFKLMKERQLKR